MKQETIEEVALNFSKQFLNNGENSEYEAQAALIGVKFGAKWQAERMYSEEEVLSMLHNYRNNFELYRNIQVLPNMFFEWFEQFKKKEHGE